MSSYVVSALNDASNGCLGYSGSMRIAPAKSAGALRPGSLTKSRSRVPHLLKVFLRCVKWHREAAGNSYRENRRWWRNGTGESFTLNGTFEILGYPDLWTLSSAVEHRLHTAGVVGSNPTASTLVVKSPIPACSTTTATNTVLKQFYEPEIRGGMGFPTFSAYPTDSRSYQSICKSA